MKLKDIFKMIELENNFNEMMGSIERKVIKIDEYGFSNKNFYNINDFIKFFKKEFYGDISKDINIINDSGYLKFNLEYMQKNYSLEKGVFLEPVIYTYNIYIEEIQVF